MEFKCISRNAQLFFQQARKILKKNGRLILRVYISPEIKEDLAIVLEKKGEMGFHAFKWRVAQALADPYVTSQRSLSHHETYL